MTLEGANVKVENSYIDIEVINRVQIYQSLTACTVFDNPGIANN